jgi:dihydrofolate reductase
MRKLKLQVQMSVDGYVAGPNGELDWMVWDWDDQLKDYVNKLTEPVDTILLGRKMADGFISHWAKVAASPDDPEYLAGEKFSDTQKIVFTKTLDKSEWPNTEIAKGDLVDEINKLKNQDGKDIIVYGGATFVSSLIKEGLIDELHLFIDPVALGNGMTIFKGLDSKQELTLANSTSYDCGIVVQCYEPKRTEKVQSA